jgi:hypothetical protein
MTDRDQHPQRCEPPEHLRGVDGEHHVYYHPAGTTVRGNPVVIRWGARAQGWWADHLDLRGHSATEAASMGYRYLAPVTPAADVAALVEALEGMVSEAAHQGWPLDTVLAKMVSDARAALARVRPAR